MMYVFESRGYDVNQDRQGSVFQASVDAQKFDLGVAIIIWWTFLFGALVSKSLKFKEDALNLDT